MTDKLTEMNVLAQQIAACQNCQLHLSRKKSVPGEGNIDSKILFIGEGPGMNENETGRPFVGQAGNFLNELLSVAKMKRQNVFITNVVKCRPPSNRDPLPEELSACALYLDAQIALIDPLIIVTLGRFSMSRYFPLQRISGIHGKGVWMDGRMIVPMFHPAAALHQPNLRDSIIRDFSMLPVYLKEAEDQQMGTTAEPAEIIDPAEEDGVKAPQTDDGVQLSLF